MRELLLMGGEGERGFALPTGTVTFLLTDIEGSTSRWAAEPDLMAPAVSRHYEIIGDAVAAHGGVRPVEQGEGDSTVSAFSRASDAIGAALCAQRALSAELGERFRVRMALHTGEAQLRDEGNYFGVAVIRCARLRSLAHGGQILVSRTATELVVDALPADTQLRDLGEVRLRDLGRREQVFQLCAPDLVEDFPPLRSIDTFPTNLPVPLTSLIGRERELIELAELARRHRLVTITGTGGAGKTRLAAQLGADLLDPFGGNVRWVELASIPMAGQIAGAVLAACGGEQTPGVSPRDSLIALLADRPTLVILDNCEQVLEGCASLVDDLLRACPDVVVVATSREPLSVPGEVSWRAPSLAAPSQPVDVSIESLRTYDSVRLFIERATLARPHFAVTAENAPLIAEICQRLDGIPLAVELAAARVRQVSVERIAAGLDDRFRLLTGGARTLLPRQQTLEASIEWSYELLDPGERAVLEGLSAFSGGFTIELAERVCAGETVDAYAVLDLVARLVDKSLVVIDDTGRYRLLESVRQFAIARARQAGRLESLRDRHLAALIAFVQDFDLTHRLTTAAQDQILVAEHANLRTAIEWSLTGGREPAIVLLHAFCRIWYCQGIMDEIADVGERMLAASAADQLKWLETFAALCSFGFTALFAWDRASVVAKAAASIDVPYLQGRLLGFAASVAALSAAYATHGPLDEIRNAREFSRLAGDELDQAFFTLRIGVIRAKDGCTSEVRESYAALQTLGVANTSLRAIVECLPAWERFVSGDLEGAIEVVRAAFPAPPQASILLSGVAISAALALDRPDIVTSIDDLVRSAPNAGLNERSRRRFRLYMTYANQGAAATIARNKEDDYQGLIDHIAVRWAVSVATSIGDIEAATEALSRWPSPPDAEVVPADSELLLARAELGFASGEFDVQLVHDAIDLAEPEGFRIVLVDALELWAFAAADAGRRDRAHAVLRACVAERESMGYAFRFDHHRRLFTAAMADVAEAGAPSLSLADAIALVQRSRGGRGRASHGWASLTPIEVDVVRLAASGLTNAAIAKQLVMSPNTVKTHLSHVFAKLAVKNRAELATFASRF